MEILIELTKDYAHYFCNELQTWGYEARVIPGEKENWATIEVLTKDNDPETYEGIIVMAFNTGVAYGKEKAENKNFSRD